MKFLGFAIIAQIVLFAAFTGGLFTQIAPLMIGAFCLWTPSAWLLGYAIARSNIQISVGTAPSAQAPTAYGIPPVAPRQQTNGSLLGRVSKEQEKR